MYAVCMLASLLYFVHLPNLLQVYGVYPYISLLIVQGSHIRDHDYRDEQSREGRLVTKSAAANFNMMVVRAAAENEKNESGSHSGWWQQCRATNAVLELAVKKMRMRRSSSNVPAIILAINTNTPLTFVFHLLRHNPYALTSQTPRSWCDKSQD